MAIPAPRLVAVTGASGFIAAHIVRELLAGRRVRGTVRQAKGHGHYSYLESLPGASSRLELVEANLETPGSYDTAFVGCDCVLHTASPYVINVKDPQRDLVEPAVNGTLNVLRSAHAARVNRVVLTSSMAAVFDEPLDGKVFDEHDWNERSSLSRNPYYYSKTLAERAAWNFMREQSPSFDLVAINPYMVLGPSIGPGLNATNAIFRDILTGVYPGILALTFGLVDVRDVAIAHVLAMESSKASGRYLCAGEALSMKAIVTILREAGFDRGYKLPRLDLSGPLATRLVTWMSYTQPVGTGSYLRTHLGKVMQYDTGRIQRELGLRFRPARESIIATAEDLVRAGHLTKTA